MATPSEENPSWDELLGSNNWAGLLNPLHLDLRNFIIRCGHFVQSAYSAFIYDNGSCGHNKANLLSETRFPDAPNYTIPQLLYATATIEPENRLVSDRILSESNFMGYIAVSSTEYARTTGRREIYISWRGTKRPHEWLNNFKFLRTSAKSIFNNFRLRGLTKNPKVLESWLSIYSSKENLPSLSNLSARDQLLSKITEIVERYKDEKLSIICVGHSLGGTMAVLSAVDIVTKGISNIQQQQQQHFPVTVVVFGCPKIGNTSFNYQLCHMPRLKILHVKSAGDIVTAYPFFLGNLIFKTWVELEVNTDATLGGFTNLSIMEKLAKRHDLRVLMETVRRWNGENSGLQLKVEVDKYIALVNRFPESLGECGILANLVAQSQENGEDDDNVGSSEASTEYSNGEPSSSALNS